MLLHFARGYRTKSEELKIKDSMTFSRGARDNLQTLWRYQVAMVG